MRGGGDVESIGQASYSIWFDRERGMVKIRGLDLRDVALACIRP